ncbi:hypothetical protein NMG60_11034683 [Bertholletia excelsa]
MENSTAAEVESRLAIRPEYQGDGPRTISSPGRYATSPPKSQHRYDEKIARKTLSERRWQAAFSQEGRLDIAGVLRRIQRGGIHPSIKGVVWEFLLGCFDPNSTFEERNQLRRCRREQYEAWKAECQKLVPIIGSGKFIQEPIIADIGEHLKDTPTGSCSGDSCGVNYSKHAGLDRKVVQWKLVLHQIGLDVLRTDRTLVFYENEANQAKLWDVLVVYAWVDNNIGYVQGMNDICSPMVILMENEADAFWCFERVMRRLRENFRSSANSLGVQSQLCNLAGIIKAVDPKLHQHLEELDGGQYLFALRMLMVLFPERVMWAMEYNPNIFVLYEMSKSRLNIGAHKNGESKIDNKMLKQYGKFERKNIKTGRMDQKNALAVFLIASVLEAKNKRLLKEARGPDDVVMVRSPLSLSLPLCLHTLMCLYTIYVNFQILGDITASLDAKRALHDALKIQQKYLFKAR